MSSRVLYKPMCYINTKYDRKYKEQIIMYKPQKSLDEEYVKI